LRNGLACRAAFANRQRVSFEITMPPEIIFGAGAVRAVGARAKTFGRCALVVTGGAVRHVEPLLADLAAHGVGAAMFKVVGEPIITTVERGVAYAQAERCDLVIGLGGGSVLDTAKAIAALLTNEGALLDYLEIIGRGQSLSRRCAPLVAIPTTAGTGAEVTRNAVLGAPAHGVKVSLRSPLMLPWLAVIDPELTHDLPPALTASTGMDALTQLIEPYVCTRANAYTDALCAEGIRRAAGALRAAFHDGRDARARHDLALASLYGGLALANAGLGAVHGFAGPLGGSFPAPHGAVCAALLAPVMAINLRALRARAAESPALRRYDEVARWLTGDAYATADAGVAWVRALVAELGIPSLKVYGVTAAHVDNLVAKARLASSMKANPVVLTVEELREIVLGAI
jgi:alcohol dehydrogenase class IV